MVDQGSSIIPLASLQYLPSELWRKLRHLAFERRLSERLYSLLSDFEQLESVYFLKKHGCDGASSLRMRAEEGSFVDHWKKAAIRRRPGF
jgi:hypothetical protein